MAAPAETRLHLFSFSKDKVATAAVSKPMPPIVESSVLDAIHPATISPEKFWMLEGIIQEAVLTSLLESGNKDKLRELRPDFQIDRPLTADERKMAGLTEAIAQRETPITPPQREIDDGLFSQIHHFVYFDFKERGDLASVLEIERKRRMQYAPGNFYPSENLGKYTAALRYRANLERQIDQNKNIPSQKAP